MDNEPFAHTVTNGIVFKSSNCHFKGGIEITVRPDHTEQQIYQGVAEMVGWWSTMVHKDLLERFDGFKNVAFRIVRPWEKVEYQSMQRT